MATGFLLPAPFEKARVASLVEASTVGVGSQYGGGQQGRHAGRGPKGYRRSDERIQEEIKDQLTQARRHRRHGDDGEGHQRRCDSGRNRGRSQLWQRQRLE